MSMSSGRTVVVALAFLAVINPVSALTLGTVAVDWTNSIVLAGSGGLENPLLRVAFNPQPEPPAGGLFSYGDPPKDGYPPDPIITHSGEFEKGTMFRLLFGISDGSKLSIPEAGITGGPIGSLLNFNVIDAVGVVFGVELELGTSSGGTAIDYVAFNPQPEPPALGEGAASFGADFSFNSFSDVTLKIRVTDAQGQPVTLTQVPEPASMLLLSLGLVLLAGCSRKWARTS